MYISADVESTTPDVTTPLSAADIARARALPTHSIDVELRTPAYGEADELRFTMYVADDGVSLSAVLPVLHSLGSEVLDERPYRLPRATSSTVWVYDFTLRHPLARGMLGENHGAQATTLRRRFREAFLACWRGQADVDAFNSLVVHAGLSWEQCALLRAYAKYLRQIGFPYGVTRIANVLADQPVICSTIPALFAARFDPSAHDAADAERLRHTLRIAIDGVLGLDADRILRAYADLVTATTRTNYFRRRTSECPRSDALALKVDGRSLTLLPQPRPCHEVFVHSPRVEGVHMRYGAVSRGGLRWSDRFEDFRTEILGLVRAQAVKNAVIVPMGAKGGFVARRLPSPTGDATADRIAQRAEGAACYQTFVAALLDVTDDKDRVTGVIRPPTGVIRHDGDDPYLVVAADKGTATFSDEANVVAARYCFWLGDAFASGGSVGYDHKGIGITARGAWESVRRHFREAFLDVDVVDFTVAGIGDMSGDVFGNAMLLSRKINLVAAFDHRHVFIDPTPDATTSYDERRRLFELPRSSWADYDRSLISEGGGVFGRTEKSVPITAAIRAALGIMDEITTLSPPQMISAILAAPVDLLFNGGIGTYVKAGTESHLDVGDKANDGVRVDAHAVRARVVGEGGNLGVTAAGRIQLAQLGCRINTDALDNSAGVDCSDHEVNIKILLDGLVSAGQLHSEQRNTLLREMSDDVARLVLANNIAQNELLGGARAAAARHILFHGRQIGNLVTNHGLDRALAALPDEAEIERRMTRNEGLTSPELATLIAHVKLALKAELLAGSLPDHDGVADRLRRYFPERLRRRYPDAIAAHPLRREIISTVLANEVVDVGGVSYLFRFREDTGASTSEAVRAYVAASAIMDIPDLMTRCRREARTVAVGDVMVAEVRRLLDRVSRWLLTHRPQPIAIGAEIARYREPVAALMPTVIDRLAGVDAEIVHTRARQLCDSLGADMESARAAFALLHGFCSLDVADIADAEGRDVGDVADLYYALNAYLRVDRLLSAISELGYDGDRWSSRARLALRADVYGAMRLLCRDVLAGSGEELSSADKIEEWASTNASRLTRSRVVVDDLSASSAANVSALAVAVHQLRDLVRVKPS